MHHAAESELRSVLFEKAQGVRRGVAAVDHDGKSERAGKFELCRKGALLCFFVRTVVVVVQPDLPDGNSFFSREQSRECAEIFLFVIFKV